MMIPDSFLNFLGHTTWERVSSVAILAVAGYLVYNFILTPAWDTLENMRDFWRQRDWRGVFLEITPPARVEKTPHATQQLFTAMDQLIAKGEILSLEIASTRREGLRYLIFTDEGRVADIQRQLTSYLPDLKFKVLENTTPPDVIADNQYWRVYEVKQTNYYAQPLQPHDDLTESDPVAMLAGSMTKLKPGETVAMQIVLTDHYAARDFRMRNRIFTKGQATINGGAKYFIISRFWAWGLGLWIGIAQHSLSAGLGAAALFAIVSLFIHSDEDNLTPAQQQMYEAVRLKLEEPLLRADIRFIIAANDVGRLRSLASGFQSSLALYRNPDLQSLRVQRYYPDQLGQKLTLFKLQRRLPSFWKPASNVLDASELASIFHFPYGAIATEGMIYSGSRSLQAPVAMKRHTDDHSFDVVLGRNVHHGEATDVGLTAAERERHVYIIGGTGNGKTTLMQYGIIQDIQNGKGVAVVDPHGDLAERLLRYIPEERLKDVIYFNPADISHPIGLNLLELPEGLIGDDLLLAQDFVTEAVVSVFRKIFSEDDSGGHRIEHVLRNAIHTAFAVEGATLFTIRKILNDPDFRKQVVAKLEDEDIKDFWTKEFALAGNYQKYKSLDGVMTKIGRFQRSVVTRRILEQPKSTINFDEILDGKILICNLAKGTIGEDTSAVLGTAILTKLQLAAYRRIHAKEAERKPFYLYVDEFQNFVSPLFIQILSESRKYKLFLTMAEQSTSQQDRQMVENILDNAGTVISFYTGNPADEELMLHQFKGHVKEDEIANLPAFNFYMRIAAGREREVVSGETIVLGDEGGEAMATKAKKASQENYAAIATPKSVSTTATSARKVRKATKATPRDRLKHSKKKRP